MKLRLEQVFYGRGELGYDVLGASPGGASLTARVEQLCGSVGTPGGGYGGEPFLLSVAEGDRDIMVCGRRGAPDSMGRDTLFFHALVAAKTELDAAKENAFTLFDQDAFAVKMPDGTVEALRIDCKPVRVGSSIRPTDGRAEDAVLPCFVRVPSPAPDAVRGLVGDRANELSWATFAFRPLDGFDVQVLPPRVAAPDSTNEYDANGKLVRAAVRQGNNGQARRPQGKEIFPGRPAGGERVVNAPPPSKSFAMFKFSLFANLVLLALCAALLASRKSVPLPVSKPEPTVVTYTVTNTVTITNVQTRFIEKRPALEESKKDFLSKLKIPEHPSMDSLAERILVLKDTRNSDILADLSDVFEFIDNLQAQKLQQQDNK